MLKNLLRSAFLVSGFTLLSRIMGMVRDMVLAFYMGSGIYADVFFVAFRIPNLFRRIFGEGAFNSAFVPVLNEEIEKDDEEAVHRFIDLTSGLLITGLLITVAVGIIGARWVVYLVAPGFSEDPEKLQLAIEALRWTFPYLFCISLVAMSAGILNSYHRFAVPAFTPVLLNLVLIGAAIGWLPLYDPDSLVMAVGVFIAGFVQLFFQFPFLRQINRLPKPKLKGWRENSGVRKVFRLMAPSLIGASAGQLNLIINTIIASFLITGSVSWLYYSDRLMEFPVGILAIAIGTVILPTLSKSYTNKDDKAFSAVLDWGLRLALLLCLPAAVALGLLALPLLTTLFMYGAFSANDAQMSSLSLTAFSFGVPAVVLIKVLAPAYFSRQDTKSPVRFALIAMACNIIFGLMLSQFYAHVGLAMALTISSNINMLLLLYFALKRNLYRPEQGWLRFFMSVLFAVIIMGAVIYYLKGSDTDWIRWNLSERIVHLAGIIVASVLAYAMVLVLCGIRPRHFYNE